MEPPDLPETAQSERRVRSGRPNPAWSALEAGEKLRTELIDDLDLIYDAVERTRGNLHDLPGRRGRRRWIDERLTSCSQTIEEALNGLLEDPRSAAFRPVDRTDGL